MGAGEEYSKYSRFCLFSLFFLYIFQDWTETLSVLRREDLFLLQHLTGISFQGLYSEMFSDSELILKGSFTGIQPSTELVILLFLIRKGVVFFQLWRHLLFWPVSYLLAFAASEVHCAWWDWVSRCQLLQLEAGVTEQHFFILWRAPSTDEHFQSICTCGGRKGSPSTSRSGWQLVNHVFQSRCSHSNSVAGGMFIRSSWHSALSRCSLF